MESQPWLFASGMAVGCSFTALIASKLSHQRASPFVRTSGTIAAAEPATAEKSAKDRSRERAPVKKDNLSAFGSGSTINTKKKNGEAPYDLSRFYYSIYGMHSYPGYLMNRFSERKNHGTNLQWLEEELEGKLREVRGARDAENTREMLLQTYQPKMILPAPREFLPSALLHAAQNESAISETLHEVVDKVYLFQLFTPEFCAQLLDQVEHFSQWKKGVTIQGQAGAEDLNDRLCVVDHMGDVGRQLLDVLRDEVVDPLSKHLFPNECTSDASSHYRYGFVLGYAKDALEGNISRKALDPHTDDSEVTLTVCLGQEYEGGEVTLKHIRSDPKEGELQQSIKMKTGQASLFLGQQLHQVEEITSGRRYIFVVWFRRQKYRAQNCPCCRMYRRDRCVYGPEMN